MRIAYIVSLFPKLSETFILREMIELRQRGHEITIVSLKPAREAILHDEARTLARDTLYPRFGWPLAISLIVYLFRRPLALASAVAEVAAVHLRRPRLLFMSLGLIAESLYFARQLRSRRVEHVHAHWATFPALAAWIIGKLNRIPYSVTGHAHDLFLPNPMLPRKVSDAGFFATISEFNRALLIQKCGPQALEKVRLIRCGLPLERFPFAPSLRTPGMPLVLSVGRLVDYKGFDILIRACALLRDEGLPVRCIIVGDGPQQARLDRLVSELQLREAVKLAAGRRQQEVAEMISGADLFVLASVAGRDGQHDGIPIVLMEAMALGVPVIATKLSGIPELVKDNQTGLLVAPGAPDHLASAMKRLLGDRDLAERLRTAGREIIEKEYDLARSVTQLCREFSQSAPAGGRARP